MSDNRLTRAGDVPAELSTLVGRDAEVTAVLELLRTARLVTVVGGAGFGKTTLARRVAIRLQCESDEDGQQSTLVRWVALSEVPRTAERSALEHVVASVYETADFSESPSPLRLLLEQVRDTPSVLVLDTAEHLADRVAALAVDLLTALPQLRILVTSRVALDVEGERIVPLGPLRFPQPGDARDTHYPSVELLITRAASLGITLGGAHMSAARELCAWLEGVPLAIVLAAGLLRRYSLEQILQGLNGNRPLAMFAGGPRYGANPTHHSLSATLDWSVDLLSEPERTLFARVSVFMAQWDEPAMREICAGDDIAPIELSALEPAELPALLERLVDLQLVTRSTVVNPPRYGMLDIVRLHAREIAQQRGEWETLQRRHRDYHQLRVSQAAAQWAGPQEVAWLNWAIQSMPDLLAAYEWSLTQPGGALVALMMALALERLRHPFFTGGLSKGRSMIETPLVIILESGDYDLSDPTIMALVWMAYALCCWVANCQGDQVAAAKYFKLLNNPPPELPAAAVPAIKFAVGGYQMLVHQSRSSIQVLGEARAGFAAATLAQGDWLMARLIEAMAAAFLGDRAEAMEITQLCLDEAKTTGAPWHWEWARLVRGIALLRFGDPAEAVTLERDTLRVQRKIGDRWGVVWAELAVAWALAAQLETGGHDGTPEEAATIVAQLLGGAEMLRRRTGVALEYLAPFQKLTKDAETQALAVLTGTTYDKVFQQGKDMTWDQVLNLAEDPRMPWTHLSEAERRIALLIADDVTITNGDIATARGVGRRTVETQVSAILGKLGLTSRHQIGPWLAARNLHHPAAERTP